MSVSIGVVSTHPDVAAKQVTPDSDDIEVRGSNAPLVIQGDKLT